MSQVASFEENISSLNDIITKLEGGDLPLEEALKRFEQGVRLARQTQQQLDSAQQRIDILMQGDQLEPYVFTESEVVEGDLRIDENVSENTSDDKMW